MFYVTPIGSAGAQTFTYAVSTTELTVEGAADIRVNKYIPTYWGAPVVSFSATASNKLPHAIYKLHGTRKIAKGSYRPDGNGGAFAPSRTYLLRLPP